MSPSRALGPSVWGRKAARLPDRGVLLVATDLQGNWDDYQRLLEIYREEEAAGAEPILACLGDLVHGPSPDLNQPGAWPSYLGTPYADRSRELILDFEARSQTTRMFALLGNHEHAHIGGPPVSKFYIDEAGVLDEALGPECTRIHAFFHEMPLIAVAPCGVVVTHGSPARTEASLELFEHLSYSGYEHFSIQDMYHRGTLGALLWSRMASPEEARELLRATALDDRPNGLVAFGHDVVREGYEKVGDEQICVSTSYGLFNENKVYLRLDLSKRYESVQDLRDGDEIRKLY